MALPKTIKIHPLVLERLMAGQFRSATDNIDLLYCLMCCPKCGKRGMGSDFRVVPNDVVTCYGCGVAVERVALLPEKEKDE